MELSTTYHQFVNDVQKSDGKLLFSKYGDRTFRARFFCSLEDHSPQFPSSKLENWLNPIARPPQHGADSAAVPIVGPCCCHGETSPARHSDTTRASSSQRKTAIYNTIVTFVIGNHPS